MAMPFFIFLKSAISSHLALLSPAPGVAVSVGLITPAGAANTGGRWRAAVNDGPAYRDFRNDLVMLCCLHGHTMAASSS